MPDIIAGDKYKKTLRLVMWYLRKRFAESRDKDEIHEEMVVCGNRVISRIYELVMKTADNINHIHQRNAIKDGTEILLWATAYKDTAYRDPFFYMLKHLLDMKDDIYKDVLKYYKEPEDWYINAWQNSKKHSKELQESGLKPRTQMSSDELIFVPQAQQKEFERIINEERKRRGW